MTPSQKNTNPTLKIILVFFFLYSLLVITKPVHIDEANFLMLTKGNFWNPHNILINWQGRTQTAFDVLSNPPGIAWFLYPVKNISIIGMRLWMMTWSVLALWSFWELGKTTSQTRFFLYFVITSPVFALSHGSFLPDMPLLACTTAGYAFFFSKKRYIIGAFLIGLGFLFRYSAIVPMVSILLWLIFPNKEEKEQHIIPILFALGLAPLFLLVHDIVMYDRFHFWHMLTFQRIEKTSLQNILQLLAVFAQGASGVFVAFIWFSFEENRKYVCVCIMIVSGFLLESLWSGIWIALGISTLTFVPKTTISRWAGVSLALGIVFLFLLRFTATRYWIPLLPLLALYLQSLFAQYRMINISFIGCGFLSFMLCLDDWEFSNGYHHIAKKIQEQNITGSRSLAGHWGLQWYLQLQGFITVEDDRPIEEDWLVLSSSAWPQKPSKGIYQLKKIWNHENMYIGPTVYSISDHSHFHANMIAPDIHTYAAWGLRSQDFDQISLWTKCVKNCDGCVWNLENTMPNCKP